MNSKAQMELSPIGVGGGIAGALVGWIIAGRMGNGIIMKVIATALTGIVCYFVSTMIANK